MQFGRIYGMGLIFLGIVLCALQFVIYMAPPKKEVGPAQTVRQTDHVISLPGYIGVGSLIAGIGIFMTARRKDEPDPKHKVK